MYINVLFVYHDYDVSARIRCGLIGVVLPSCVPDMLNGQLSSETLDSARPKIFVCRNGSQCIVQMMPLIA